MSIYLFLVIFSGLTIFYTLLGIYASKNVNSVSDYFLADRKLGFFNVAFTLIAIQLGGGMLLGTSQKAYYIGLYGILYTLGMSVGFILLSLGFAAKLQTLKIDTTAQIFEIKYKSTFLRKFASLLSILTLCGIFICQIVASKTLLNGIGIYNEFLFIFFWLFIISYTIIGGLKAVAMTDAAQVIFIIIIFGSLFLYNILQSNDLISTISFVTKNQNKFILNYETFMTLLPTLVMPALFSLIEQDLAQQFFASKTKRIATLSAIAAGLFMTVFALIPIYFGAKAKVLGLNLPGNCSPLTAFLSYQTNDFVLSLAICGIIAAITSTANSLLCAISSNIAQDFNIPLKLNKLKLAKIITLITGLTCLVLSYTIGYDVIDILIESYQISVICLFVPLMFAIFSKNLSKFSAYCAIIFGLLSFLILKPLNFHLSGLISILFSLIGFLLAKKYYFPNQHCTNDAKGFVNKQ